MHRLNHDIDARLQRRVKEYASCHAHTARRAAADNLRHLRTRCREQHLCVILQTTLEGSDHLSAGSFLRTKDRRRAAFAEQWIINIAGHINPAFAQARVEVA